MVVAVAAYAAIAAATAIAQAYSAEQTRGANKKKLSELKKAYDAIVPPEYNVSVNSPPQYLQQELGKLNLDFSKVTPEDYKVVGAYAPQAAPYIEEHAPQIAQRTAAGQEGRQSQIDALRSYKAAAAGNDPRLKVGLDQAAAQAQAGAQARSQSILEQAQRQGRGNSGATLAAQLQGGSDAMQMGAQQGQQAAIAAYQAKMDAIRNSGQMGRQLSMDDLGEQQQNADTINQFNQRTSRAYQQHLNDQAAMANDAQRYNLGQQQQVANQNVRQRNDAQTYNLENKNRLIQQQYGANRDERNYQNSLAEKTAQWGANEKERQNNLMHQAYQDKLARVQGSQGLGVMQMDMNNQAGQARSGMIQGAGQAVSGIVGAYDADQRQGEAQDREDARQDRYLKARYPNHQDEGY